MFRHMAELTILSVLKASLRMELLGGSVANANAAKVSMMIFTQSSYMAVREGSFSMQAPKKTINMATRLTVSWNWMNLRTLSKIFLPYLSAVRIEQKVSSISCMSLDSLARSVPACAREKPISASFKACASSIVHPVTATLLPTFFKPLTRRSLS